MHYKEFIKLLTTESEHAKVAWQFCVDDWMPQEPPVTILFSAMGDKIAENLNVIDADKKIRIFSLIEEAMNSHEVLLVTAVATGLIETMVTTTELNKWVPETLSLFGPKSLSHAKCWLGIS